MAIMLYMHVNLYLQFNIKSCLQDKLPNAMSRAAGNAFYPHISGALADGYAIISGPYGAVADGNSARELQVYSICVRAPTWCSDIHILDQNVVAVINSYVHCLAVQ